MNIYIYIYTYIYIYIIMLYYHAYVILWRRYPSLHTRTKEGLALHMEARASERREAKLAQSPY